MMICAYKEPKNSFERELNLIYQNAEECINRRTYAGLDPVVVHLVCIYEGLTDEQKEKLADHFYQLFFLTNDEEDEEGNLE